MRDPEFDCLRAFRLRVVFCSKSDYFSVRVTMRL